MEQYEIQFYLPVTLSYLVACVVALLMFKRLGLTNNEEHVPSKPWLEFVLAIVAIMILLLLGRLYSNGFLLPKGNSFFWVINNIIIYSPVFITVILRKQPLSTLWLDLNGFWRKLSIGIVSAVAATFTFVILKKDWFLFQAFSHLLQLDQIGNFIAVFLEGVAVVYLFIRLKWISNLWMAISIPSILFAISHLPRMLQQDESIMNMLMMSGVNGGICAFVIYRCYRAKDIIWLGIVHYFMDVLIGSFS